MTDNQDIFVLDKDAALAAILEEECANIDSGPARLPLTAMFVHDNPASRVANWLAIATHHMTVPEGLTVKFYASDDDAGSGGIVAVGDGRQGAVIVGWSDLDSYASEKDGVEFWRRTDAGLISEMLRELLFEANQLVPLARKIWPIERRKADVPLSGLLYDQRRPNTMSDRAAEAIADLMLQDGVFRGRSCNDYLDECCDECGAVTARLISTEHDPSCSLYPANIVIDGGEGNDPLDIPEDRP